MLTGRYSYEHRADTMLNAWLDGRYPTLAEAFAANGYATSAFVANESNCAANLGFARGFAHFSALFWSPEDAIRWTRFGQKLGLRIAEMPVFGWYQTGRRTAGQVNQSFLHWLDKRPERPFFAWLNYYDAHDPYVAPAPYATRYSNVPANGNPGSFRGGTSESDIRISVEETAWQIDAYDAAISYLDAELGALFDALRERGLYDRTIIVITSDHGEAFGEHRLYGHANSLYGEVLQVPLIVRYPQLIAAGSHVPRTVSLRDLPATLAQLANLEPVYQFPGRSLFGTSAAEPVVSELGHNPYHPSSHPVSRGSLTSISTADWHAIFQGDAVELYARSDRLEKTRLEDTTEGRETVALLREQLQAALGGGEISVAP
jgi:arylsulfatase A-like enzyme